MNRPLFLALALGLGAAVIAGALLGRHSTSVPSADVIARGQQSIRSLAAEIAPNTTVHTLTYDYNVADAVPGESREEWYAFDVTGHLDWIGAIALDGHGATEQSDVLHTLPQAVSAGPAAAGKAPPLAAVSIDQFRRTITGDVKLPDPQWGTPDPSARGTAVRGRTAYAVTFRSADGATTVFFDARTYEMLRQEFQQGGAGGPLRYRDDVLTIEVLPGDAIPPALKDAPATG